MAPDPGGVRRARIAIAGIFFLVGCFVATWFTQIPLIRERAGLSPAALSLALIAPTAGALLSMQLGGVLTARFGSRRMLRITAPLLPLPLLGLAVADTLVAAVAVFLLLGIIDGLADVAMNSQGIAVERAAGRPVLNGLHGAWGVGAIAGAGLSTGALALHWTPLEHLGALTVVLVAAAFAAGPFLLATDGPASARPSRSGFTGWLRGWNRRLLVLGVIGAAVMLSEGAVSNWAGVYLREYKDAAPALAAAGYTVFTVAEMLARFAGDRVQLRAGPARLVRVSALIFCGGLVLVLLGPSVWTAIGGLALVGIGIAPMNPVAFSAVGRSGGDDGTSVSHYTTLSYTGILAGPAIIGGLAEAFGLPIALATLLVPLILIGVGAGVLAPPPTTAPPDRAPNGAESIGV
jgi:fucose permease